MFAELACSMPLLSCCQHYPPRDLQDVHQAGWNSSPAAAKLPASQPRLAASTLLPQTACSRGEPVVRGQQGSGTSKGKDAGAEQVGGVTI